MQSFLIDRYTGKYLLKTYNCREDDACQFKLGCLCDFCCTDAMVFTFRQLQQIVMRMKQILHLSFGTCPCNVVFQFLLSFVWG